MNAQTLLAIATAVVVLFAGLGAVGAVAADDPAEHPTDEELSDAANASDDGHGPHHANDSADRSGSTGPMWGAAENVPNDIPTNVTHMHEVMQSHFDDEEAPYRFGETIRSIADGEHPWSEEHPRNDRGDDYRHGNGR